MHWYFVGGVIYLLFSTLFKGRWFQLTIEYVLGAGVYRGVLPSGNRTWPAAFSPNIVATLGVLAVGFKTRCLFEVVSGTGGKFDEPHSTQAPSSSVFKGSLARMPGDLSRNSLTLGLNLQNPTGHLFFQRPPWEWTPCFHNLGRRSCPASMRPFNLES